MPKVEESLPGFFLEENPASFKDLMVTIDTNILISLLTVTETTYNKLYSKLKDINEKKRLFIPNHVAEEYLLNAEDICRLDGKIFANASKKIQDLFSSFKNLENDYKAKVNSYDEIKNKIQEIENSFEEFFKSKLIQIDYEKRKNDVKKLLSNVGLPYEKKIFLEKINEISLRYSLQLPPGYEDKDKKNGNSFGDCLNWFQIIDFARENHKDIMYVTMDVKNDWVKDKKFRKELYNEFYNETGRIIYMYTPETFIPAYEKLQRIAKDKITDTVTLVDDLIEALKINSPSNNFMTADTNSLFDIYRNNSFSFIPSYDLIPSNNLPNVFYNSVPSPYSNSIELANRLYLKNLQKESKEKDNISLDNKKQETENKE